MLDFTKNTTLEPTWQKRYERLRALLYALAFAWALALAYGLIFPTLAFDYFFNPDAFSKKNTILDPRDQNNAPLENGKLTKDKKLLMDTALLGNFSDATLSITAGNDVDLSGSTLLAHKSYRAFLYPVGDPVGFREGSLLFSAGDFYLVSNGERRQFASQDLATELGFTPDMFLMVDANELDYNKQGEKITQTNYPDGTTFVIEDTYYQLKNNLLYPFVSAGAFLSRYEARTALKKDRDFLSKFEVSQEQLGLADGTLAAIGISVYILSAGKSYPVASPQVFEELGYDWNALYVANSEEVGIYKKQKQFGEGSTHPDGTIFQDEKIETYYLIENGKKRPLLGTHLIASYATKIKPVVADSTSLNQTASCSLKKAAFWQKNTYTCRMPLAQVVAQKGNDYQFLGQFNATVAIDQIHAKFHTALNFQNARNSLSRIKNSAITLNVPK
ncbi:MAG: hypothetical protein WA064_00440 [Candidatus Moraniibacteriota bacterium]